MDLKQNVLIYRNHLLAPSETFIKAQGESLKLFRPFYVGLRRVKGLELPENRVRTINNGDYAGRAEEIIFKRYGYSFRLARRLTGLKPKLIHAHFGPDGVSALPLARKLQIPLIVTIHAYDINKKMESYKLSFENLKQLKLKTIIRFNRYIRKIPELTERADLFIAISEFTRQKMLQRGFPKEKIMLHYIGVDTDYFKPDLAIKKEPIVLFVGRLVEKKGCEYLIKAMSKVQKSHPEKKLIIIGDGPLRESLELLASDTLSNFRFLGVQTPDAVRSWMKKAKILCLPSITAADGDAEGLPIVAYEAHAMGIPVAGFASAGIPEFVMHGETGFLAQEKDWETLAGHIMKLFEDEDLWKRFSVSARERVCEKFDLKTQTQKLEEIYRNVIEQHAKRV